MQAINFGKRIFGLFPITFFIHLIILPAAATGVNAQQKTPASPDETSRQTAPVADNEKECERLYKVFSGVEICRSTREQRKIAARAGWEFIEKCAANPENREIIDYLRQHLPVFDAMDTLDESISRFNDSIKDAKNVNAKEAFASGAEILRRHPGLIDVMLVLASVGFDQATAKSPVDTYNDDAINYAKLAIRKIENGATSKHYGAYNFSYKTKENALAWMNYTIGYITYFRQNNKKDAISYLYKATLYETGTQANPKNNPAIYQAIGDYYRREYNRLDEERAELALAAAKAKTGEAERKLPRDKHNELLARQKSFGEKMFDAYARAYHFAGGSDEIYKDKVYLDLKTIYRFLFDGETGGFDEYMKSVINSPMLEPASE